VDSWLAGEVPEWLIGTVCKTVALTGFAGSNPALSTIFDSGEEIRNPNFIVLNKFKLPKIIWVYSGLGA
jgi:hypothetical protein